MTEALQTATLARPGLAIRVGVTGTRTITQLNPHLAEQLDTVLAMVREILTDLATHSEAQPVYGSAADGSIPLDLQMLSPLAQGGDRLVAHAALKQKYRLHVPMPFPQAVYEQDFMKTAGSVEEFRHLLAQAETNRLELDGQRDDPDNGRWDESRSYEAVGRYVVRNCDLLIAIWDGKPENGRGGTAQMVRHAMESGPPVWWIHASKDVEPVWLNEAFEPQSTAGVTGQAAQMALRDYLTRLILPPKVKDSPLQSLLEHLTHLCHRKDRDPVTEYLQEQTLSDRWYWRIHSQFIRFAAWQANHIAGDPERPDNVVARTWYDHYATADHRSASNGARYRSAYVWIFLLAAVALTLAACSLLPDNRHAAEDGNIAELMLAGGEGLALAMILVLLIANFRKEWHQRWIDYRLLAELCRKQQALAPIGWSLPGRRIATLVEQAEQADKTGSTLDRTAWVAWLFAASMRAAALPTGCFDPNALCSAKSRVLHDLVREQYQYHRHRMTLYRRASHHLVLAGEVLFILVFVVVLLKFFVLFCPSQLPALLWLKSHGEWGSLAALILPTLAAASVGVRAYAELQLLADQSNHMRGVMLRARKLLAAVDVTEPLASQRLGAIMLNVANIMLQEVDGWARMFRVKVVEAG